MAKRQNPTTFSYHFTLVILLTFFSPFLSCVIRSNERAGNYPSDMMDLPKSETLVFPVRPHSVYDLDRDLDLEGKTIKIPENVTIRQRRGVIKNGILIGNRTKIISKSTIFDRVTIQGTWEVENISTGLFRNLNYNNSLRDVLALANPTIKNRIVIEKGNYNISLNSNNKVGITVPSNTNLIIDGNITLIPNNLIYYEIVNAKGHNITISGKGSIIGDKNNHTGTTGEWGMGIFVRGRDVCVRNITIRDCWGDCIYVGGNSLNVHIDKCLLDNGRRQGISITSARNVYINDCIIKNVSGTAPQFAIDLEPNKGDTVSNIFIHNVTIQNCVGGITANGVVKNAYLGDVYIDNCSVDENVKANSYQFFHANKVRLYNCIALNDKKKITFGNVNIVETRKNRVKGRSDMETYKSCKIVNGKNYNTHP